MKKLLALVTSCALILSCGASTFAANVDNKSLPEEPNYIYVNSEADIDWSNMEPNDIYLVPNENASEISIPDDGNHNLTQSLLKGLQRPRELWDLKKQGRYTFQGSNELGDLYTNFMFGGYTASYAYRVQNNKSSAVNVSIEWGTDVYREFSVPGNVSAFTTINLGWTKHFYFRFKQPANVEGYVEI